MPDRYLMVDARGPWMSDIVPREKVSQQGVRAAGGLVGGLALLLVLGPLAGLLPLLGGVLKTLLSISGIGLLGFGGYNAFQFIRNLRRRM